MDLFETRYTISKETYEELKWHLLSQQDKFAFVLGILCGIIVAISGIFSQRLEFTLFGIALIAISITELILRPKRFMKIFLQRTQESIGATEFEVQTSFTENCIKTLNFSTNGASAINYTDINNFVETKNMYVLITKAHQFMAVNKATLIQEGQSEEFLRFIKNKLLNIKMKSAV